MSVVSISETPNGGISTPARQESTSPWAGTLAERRGLNGTRTVGAAVSLGSLTEFDGGFEVSLSYASVARFIEVQLIALQ